MTRFRLLLVLSCLAVVGGVLADPAAANDRITAQGATMSPSANCTYGDIEVTYDASDVARQAVTFTSEDGTTLDSFETNAYQQTYSGLEYILSETATPAAAGTRLGVHVVIGTTPPQAATSAEFFVLYRCDGMANEYGGANEQLYTCYGDYGSCPATAVEAIAMMQSTTTTAAPASTSTTTGAPPATPATPVQANPAFTG